MPKPNQQQDEAVQSVQAISREEDQQVQHPGNKTTLAGLTSKARTQHTREEWETLQKVRERPDHSKPHRP